MIKIIVLFLAILSYTNAHNIATYAVGNVIPDGLAQWTSTNLPVRISSYGVRQDQFIQYLNVPALPTTPLVATNFHIQGLTQQIPSGVQLSVPINIPIRGLTQQIPTGLQLSVPINIPSGSNQVTSSTVPQNIQQSRPIQSATGTVAQHASPQPSNKIPLNLNMPVINPLGTQYISPFPASTKPMATNQNRDNDNRPSQGIPFNVPSGDQNFGQSLRPMFIETTRKPANNNDQTIPINPFLRPIIPNQNNGQIFPPSNTFLPPIIPNQIPNSVTDMKVYETPKRGSGSVQNTNLYSPPSAAAGTNMQSSEQLRKANGQSSTSPLNNIYTINNIPLLLSYN